MASREDRAKIEQIVGECFLKAANIILSSRVAHASQAAPSHTQPQRCWFNLEVDDVQSAQEDVQQWRRDLTQPKHIEIYLQAGDAAEQLHRDSSGAEPATVPERGSLAERWTVAWQHDQRAASPQSSRLEPAGIYKRLVIMLRSLFTFVRVLPAYRTYRAAKRSRSGERLSYRLSKGPSVREVVDGLQRYAFHPVKTPYGTLKMSVEYRPAKPASAMDQSTAESTAAAPNIIQDYVGSRAQGTSYSNLSASLHNSAARGAQLQKQPSSPLLRRHSWSLNTARTQSGGELPSPRAPVRAPSQGLASRRNSTEAQSPVSNPPQGHVRGSRGPSPSAFAPHTPSAAATPPKYPGSGLAARVSQAAAHAAAQAAAKLYSGYVTTAASPRSRSTSDHSSELPTRREGSPAAAAPPPSILRPDPSQAATLASKPSGDSPQAESAPGSKMEAARPSSQPVRIPGCEHSARRLRSTADLCGMGGDSGASPLRSHQPSRMAPASAPAAATLFGFTVAKPAEAECTTSSPFAPAAKAEEGGSLRVAQPETPPALPTFPSLCSESSNSFSSSFPASCSPQLPFAFTPSGHSHISSADVQRAPSGMPAVSPPNRDVTALAVARQPRWPIHTSLSGGREGAGSAAGVGYSVSPILGSLDSSLHSASTPKNRQPPGERFLTSPMTRTRGSSGQAAGSESSHAVPRPAHPVEAALLASDGTESDSLPFALDGDASVTSQPPHTASNTAIATPSQDRDAEADAAVGAFVRLIQDAPPLRPAGSEGVPAMTLQAGLEQLAELRSTAESFLGSVGTPPTQE